MNYCTRSSQSCEYATKSGDCNISACVKYANKTLPLQDGIYMELFAVKNGTRYNAKIIHMKDVSTTLTSSLMDGIEKLWT